jgi:hypothetical protein
MWQSDHDSEDQNGYTTPEGCPEHNLPSPKLFNSSGSEVCSDGKDGVHHCGKQLRQEWGETNVCKDSGRVVDKHINSCQGSVSCVRKEAAEIQTHHLLNTENEKRDADTSADSQFSVIPDQTFKAEFILVLGLHLNRG